MSAVTTTVTPLPDSRVRVEAEVAPTDVERALARTAQALGRDLRVPGFRKGKVPPPVVVRRFGREAILDETLRQSLGGWLVDAVGVAGIAMVGDPSVDVGEAPPAGQPVRFSFEVGVRPTATLGDLDPLEVGRREPDAGEDAVDAELEQLRGQQARLEAVDRPAAEGDSLLASFVGRIDGEEFEGGAARDQVIELGAGRLVPGFEDQLQGATAGAQVEVRVTFPDDYGAEHLQGREAVFTVDVHEVQERRLPDLDDDFAQEAAGAESLTELRSDLAERLRERQQGQIDGEFREAVLDTVQLRAEVDVPTPLASARAKELLDQTLHQLQHQGISRELYFQMTGRSEEEVVAEATPEAERALRREAAVVAYAEAEGVEPAEGDLLTALTGPAAQQGMAPEKLLERLDGEGRRDELADDVRQQLAIERLVEHATPVAVDDARARGLLWTPEPTPEGEPADTGGRPWATAGDADADDGDDPEAGDAAAQPADAAAAAPAAEDAPDAVGDTDTDPDNDTAAAAADADRG